MSRSTSSVSFDAEWLGQHVDVADLLELGSPVAQGDDVGGADDDRHIGQALIRASEGHELPA